MSARPSVICFGEILWDVLPAGALPGGAPMNVAYHLNNLGVQTSLISRIGNDEPGKKLLALLQSWGLSTQYCQTDEQYNTSEVIATEGENHEMSYEILYPVAWDFIEYETAFDQLIASADALVFGSLVTRNSVSASTLHSLLSKAIYPVFDINLRAPHYSPATIKGLLQKTRLLKLNENEVTEVGQWYSSAVRTPDDAIRFLQDEFNIQEFIITKGSKGATYIAGDEVVNQKAYPVKVADTIGSGDSFLAGFLSQKLQGADISQALDFAATLASFVTQNKGACPAYTTSDLEKFRQHISM